MAAGNITEQVAIIGKIAAEGDMAGVEEAKGKMIRTLVLSDPLSSVKVAASEVAGRIGVLAAYLPPELGNEALRIFDANHPIFGRVIPDDLESALATGKQLGKQFALKKQIEAENTKKLRQAAELGVVLPDGEEEVTSDQAARILNAVRKKRAESGDAMAVKEMEELKDWEAERVAKVKAAELAAMSDPSEEDAEDEDFGLEEEEEYTDCPECGEDYYQASEGCHGCGYRDEKLLAAEKAKFEAAEAAEIAAITAARAAPKVEYDSPF
ncbi:hypothetical protein [Stenotrophomonas phage BUCTxx99]|nr:hypothetical protein [Stenotrophomonas phage BUCTxx99]